MASTGRISAKAKPASSEAELHREVMGPVISGDSIFCKFKVPMEGMGQKIHSCYCVLENELVLEYRAVQCPA